MSIFIKNNCIFCTFKCELLDMLSTILSSAKKYVDGVVHFVYPEYCSVCKIVLPEGMGRVCLPCEESFRYTYFESYTEPSPLDKLFYGRVPLKSTFSLLNFSQGTNTQELVHEIKYLNNKQLAVYLGEKMGEKLSQKWENELPDAFIPVPLHPKKLHLRGYNQSQLLSSGISNILNVPTQRNVLVRNVNTKTQTKKGKYDRWDNVEDIFNVKNVQRWKNKHLCIVDDVITTGSTLESCVRALQQSIPGVQVSVISLAMAKK